MAPPRLALAFQLRSALQVGLSPEQMRSITSEQALRIAAGEPLEPAGEAVGERERPPHLLLDRVTEFLLLERDRHDAGWRSGRRCWRWRGSPATFPTRSTTRPLFAAIRGLLDAFDAYSAEHPDDRRRLTIADPRRDGRTHARGADPGRRPLELIPGCAPRSASAPRA